MAPGYHVLECGRMAMGWPRLGHLSWVGGTTSHQNRAGPVAWQTENLGGEIEIQRKLISAVGLAVAGFVWSRLLPFLSFEGTVLQVFEGGARVFLVLAGTLAGFRGVDALGAWATKKAGKTESTLDDILVPLGRKTLKVLVIAMGAVNLAPLLGAAHHTASWRAWGWRHRLRVRGPEHLGEFVRIGDGGPRPPVLGG